MTEPGRVVSGSVIDLHFHALPGIDDGPADLERAVDLCRAATAAGTTTIAATPHINYEWPEVDAEVMHSGVHTLRRALRNEGVDVDLRTGAEVALVRALDLGDEELRRLSLDEHGVLLLELPWRAAPAGIAGAVQRVAARGFMILVAHPERTPMLRDDPRLVGELVDSGAYCCLNAASLTERAGRATRAAARRLLAEGLVHAVASDAHDTVGRRPEVAAILRDTGFSAGEVDYFTRESPAALLDGHAPARARPRGRRRNRWWRRGRA